MHNITLQECSRIAQDLQIRKVQVESVVQLLDEGNTVPFITRYRKERTGGVNEEVIRQIQSRMHFLRQLHDRKQTILKSIDAQGKLTDALQEAIQKADTTKRLEDLYLPYKPKKRSLAAAAREKGLEPLALAVWYSDAAAAGGLDELIAGMVNPDRQLNTTDDVRLGLQHILAELTAETADVRAVVRRVLWETGRIVSGKSEKLSEGQGLEYKDYFEFTEPARQIPPHRILALNRGEKEGAIRVKLECSTEQVHQQAMHALAEHLLAIAGKMPPLPPPPPEPAPAIAAAPEPHAEMATADGAAAPPPIEAPAEPVADGSPAATEPPPSDPPAEVIVAAAAAETPAPEATSAAPVSDTQPLVASLTPSEAAPMPLQGEAFCPGSAFCSPHAGFLRIALEDALARLMVPSLEREIRNELTDEAESHAVSVFARNLRSLLLQPPLRGRRVLALDPGFRTGCKVAALDEYGNLLEHTVIYPFGGGPKKGPREKKNTTPAVAESGVTPVAVVDGQVIAAPAEPAAVAEQAQVTEAPASEPTLEAATPEAATATPETATPETATPEAATATPETATPETAMPETATPAAEAAPAEAPAANPQAATPQTATPAVERRAEARARMQELVNTHNLSIVALGNGTGCRETEELIAELIGTSLPDLSYVIVNEAGASVYSVSPVGREEFPSYDTTTRSAISIGRRLQDPLSELVKIDPQSIGVGLYQHDMGKKELKESLEGVIESSVNLVGVDLNTASVPLLRYVSGLNQLVARELVDYRKQNGPFGSREQLMQVPSLGPARYTQAAGFLKIPGASNPLDHTWIHPESYGLAERILVDLGYGPEVLSDPARQEEMRTKLSASNVGELAQKLGAGLPTVADIVQALLKPGRDPREDLPPPIFKKGILRLEDLQPGMELKGTVLNVVDFGAFVDIGLKDSGLVHISQIANRYIKSPYDVVAVNDVVTVWVLNVDQDRHRVSLTMIQPGSERQRQERRPPVQRQPQPGPRPPQPPRPPRREPGGQNQGPTHGPPGERRGPPRGRGPGRGPQPPRESPALTGSGAEASSGGPPARSAEPARPLPPPRKPRREPPHAKLTKEAIEGKVPLRTFGELSALFAVKRDEPIAPAEPAPSGNKPTAAGADQAPAPASPEQPAEPQPAQAPPESQAQEGEPQA
jgi:protein Tex